MRRDSCLHSSSNMCNKLYIATPTKANACSCGSCCAQQHPSWAWHHVAPTRSHSPRLVLVTGPTVMGLNQWCCVGMKTPTCCHQGAPECSANPRVLRCLTVSQTLIKVRAVICAMQNISTWPGGNATCCDELTVPDTGAAEVAYAHGLNGIGVLVLDMPGAAQAREEWSRLSHELIQVRLRQNGLLIRCSTMLMITVYCCRRLHIMLPARIALLCARPAGTGSRQFLPLCPAPSWT